jgi:hypothetical protein
MSHPTTTKYQSDLCTLLDLSPQLAALYLSRHRLITQSACPASAYCPKCGSLASTRISKQFKRAAWERCLIHNCQACGHIRKTPIVPRHKPIAVRSPSISAPSDLESKNVKANSEISRVTKSMPQHATAVANSVGAQKKKRSTLQQLLAKNREQKMAQSSELGISSFLQQL